MTLTYILASLIGLVYPLYLLWTHKKTNDRIKKDEKYRFIDYQQTIIIFWTLTILILVNLFINPELPLNFYPVVNTVGVVLGILIAIFVVLQIKQSTVTAETITPLKDKMKDIFHYLPKTRKELAWFILLSISAGICEEIVFRLFMFSFLVENVHIAIAFIVTNSIFALTHIGSGKQNLISSFILGLVFSTMYYFTDNIWLPIILHIAIDINAGILGYKTKKFEESHLGFKVI